MPLFEIAIIKKLTKKESEAADGAEEQLVYGPVGILARDAQSAGMRAIRDEKIPKDLNLDRAEVLIRPFAGPPAKA